MTSYYYCQVDKNAKNAELLEMLEDYADNSKKLVYVIDRPLGDLKYSYKYSEALIILSPKHKAAIIDYGNKKAEFENYVEDIIEDIGSISDKFLYKEIIGRPRSWRSTMFDTNIQLNEIINIETFFEKIHLNGDLDKKKVELLISLLIGSINDIERVKEEVPTTTLDKVKQKIQLFDGDQTRFVYETPQKKRIVIQGLSGTGKTELLLHKLKDLYISDSSSKIFFTCHNKILADSLRNRVPSFFNFLKVEQQIEWESRLWCTNAWGSSSNPDSGAYRYICATYGITFNAFSYQKPFPKVCEIAIQEIKAKFSDGKIPFAFTYMFIDESQDFDENFFALCELVTEKSIYIAGDIFQSIFDEEISSSIAPDFLLGKCYRTDPKTLMFAHALGMGLFEEKKLRWLEEKEWVDCGYQVSKDELSRLHLSREPLRRFEDLDERYESIKIVDGRKNLTETIIQILDEIVEQNETVSPDDIGIIFLDNNKEIYPLADKLEFEIQEHFAWGINKAYETKERIKDTILISNRNNVKGLEFPFVICVTEKITRSPSYRNSLYTMLTRSFIKSYLVVPDNPQSGLTSNMKEGLKHIITHHEMVITEPSEREKKNINTSFQYSLKKLSYYDMMVVIFNKLKIDKKYRDKLFIHAQQMGMLESDPETLTDFIKTNYRFIKVKE